MSTFHFVILSVVVAALMPRLTGAWCPEDWTYSVGVGCYLTSDPENPVHFDEARLICQRLGASLLSINDKVEREKIEEIMRNDWGHYWVGAEFNRSMTDLLWDDGTRVERSWVKGLPSGSPSNRKRHRSCVVFRSIMKFPDGREPITSDAHLLDFQLHSNPCDVSWRYICEKRNVTTTLEPTTLTTPTTTPTPQLEPSSVPACEPKTITVTVTETMVSSIFVKQIQGPIVLPAGFDTENETSADETKVKEFPSRFSPAEKSVRQVISKSLGTMAIMIVVIVLVGICLLDIPCERFCGDDNKKSSSSRSGWLCGCGRCKKKTSRRSSSHHAGVVTTLTAPQHRPQQRFSDGNSAVLGMAPPGGREMNDLVSAASLSKSLSNIDEEGVGLNTTAESIVVQPITPAKVQSSIGVNLMGMTTPVRQRNGTGVSQSPYNGTTPSLAVSSAPNRYVSAITLPTPMVSQTRQSSPSLLDTEIRKRQLRSGMPSFKPTAPASGGADLPSMQSTSSTFAQPQGVNDTNDNPLDSPLHRKTDEDHDALGYPVLEPMRPQMN